jgi:pyruvate/2-oxoglutarate dehydrogenase complex dihydrolipoamide dehydrogenase (E3) component/uncharacterized membrane protein YdjX (TVP38/TMEM64 family)
VLNFRKLVVLLLVLLAVVCFFWFDLGRFLRLEEFQSRLQPLLEFRDARPLTLGGAYFCVYVLVTGFSLPGATVLTLGAGALFGLVWGTLLASFASTAGATLSFLTSRYLLRDWVQHRWGAKLKTINRGVEKDGALYLFSLRLVPVFPFFLVNLVMGLTPIGLGTFCWVSQVGMLAGTLVFVNAGQQLSHLTSLSGIVSPGVLVSFGLLGCLPLVGRSTVSWLQSRRVYAGWSRPRRFDRNIIVIGAGSAGLVTAYIAAAVRARVTLIERHKMGGDCLNTGCVPSKALIRSAKVVSQIRKAGDFGIQVGQVRVDFGAVMERVQRVIREVEPHDSVERYSKLGVECLQGAAKLISPWAVEISSTEASQTLTARNIVIAAGARPTVPAIVGLANVKYYTSDTIWELRTLPGRLLVLGGGPIGCELAQCFARFGSQVTIVQSADRLLPREDVEICARVTEAFEAEGIRVLTGHRGKQFLKDEQRLLCEHLGETVEIAFDEVLIALGRTANVEGYGLEELGVNLSPSKTIGVDEFLSTNFPNILACGDVAGPYQFTHVAAHQAWFAAVNSLFGNLRRFPVDYSVIPWATFTDPEVARVGLNEQDAKREGIAYELASYDLEDLDRAIADGTARGVVKVLTVPGSDRILGATIVGEHAGDILAEYVCAMKNGLGMNKILSTIHIYPTLAEANKFAAGQWKKQHQPERLLSLVEKLHSWRRR